MSLLTGLVSAWSLDGSSADLHGANPGTDTAISYSAVGGALFPQAATGNGSSSKIDVGAANLNLTAAMSIALRGKFTTGPSGYTFLVNRLVGGGGSSSTYESRINSLKVEFGGAGGLIQSTLTLTAGNWYNLLFTRSAGNAAKIYIDSVLEASGSVPAPTSLPSQATLIGTRDDNYTFFDSVFSQILIYNRELSGAEAIELHNGGPGLAYPFSAPPVIVEPEILEIPITFGSPTVRLGPRPLVAAYARMLRQLLPQGLIWFLEDDE